MDDRRTIVALYPPGAQIDPLIRSLSDADIDAGRIAVVTPLPLEDRASARIGPVPFYAVTIVAGLIGIGIGIFLAAGTALMYPLMTGGKPIVGKPIVAIISYETMMLTAIIVTFVTMIANIKWSHRAIENRDARVDEGCIMVTVSVPADSSQEIQVRSLLQQARPLDVYVTEPPTEPRAPEEGAGARAAAAMLAAMCFASALTGCSRDMQEQPSYQPLEAPRLHSPKGAVPRQSRSIIGSAVSTSESKPTADGVTLFRINCSHCHGTEADGKGAVAMYLKEKPANLHGPEVQQRSEADLFKIVSNGKGMMPPFQGELSAAERLSVATYIKSLPKSE